MDERTFFVIFFITIFGRLKSPAPFCIYVSASIVEVEEGSRVFCTHMCNEKTTRDLFTSAIVPKKRVNSGVSEGEK